MTEKEIQTVIEAMEFYVTLMTNKNLTATKRIYWKGSALTLKDILCRLGHEDSIPEWMDDLLS